MTHVAGQDRAAGRTEERRRSLRMANPSPELISLMRKPTSEARRRLSLYDAPNFLVPDQAALRSRPHRMHFARVVGAVCVCIGIWGGSFTAMMMVWG